MQKLLCWNSFQSIWKDDRNAGSPLKSIQISTAKVSTHHSLSMSIDRETCSPNKHFILLSFYCFPWCINATGFSGAVSSSIRGADSHCCRHRTFCCALILMVLIRPFYSFTKHQFPWCPGQIAWPFTQHYCHRTPVSVCIIQLPPLLDFIKMSCWHQLVSGCADAPPWWLCVYGSLCFRGLVEGEEGRLCNLWPKDRMWLDSGSQKKRRKTKQVL